MEDRALFCRDCDEAIHVAGSLSGNHQRYLATGIRVALSSICNKESNKGHYEPPNQNFGLLSPKVPTTQENPSSFMPSAWAVDEFLQLSDYESGDKVRGYSRHNVETIFDLLNVILIFSPRALAEGICWWVWRA